MLFIYITKDVSYHFINEEFLDQIIVVKVFFFFLDKNKLRTKSYNPQSMGSKYLDR